MSALADAIGCMPSNPTRLVEHLARSISDATAIRSHVKRETGVDMPIARVTALMERARARGDMLDRKSARLASAPAIDTADFVRDRQRAVKSNDAFVRALAGYGR